jgi:DNA-binding CsgD family transcriptional regulator
MTETPLTKREQEVLRCFAAGLSSREIANQLFVSKRTVDFHASNAYRKMGVRNRVQALNVEALIAANTELSVRCEEMKARAEKAEGQRERLLQMLYAFINATWDYAKGEPYQFGCLASVLVKAQTLADCIETEERS